MNQDDRPQPPGQPVTPEVVGPHPGAASGRRSRPLRAMLVVCLLLLFAALAFTVLVLLGSLLVNTLLAGSSYDSESRVREKFHSGVRSGGQKVAIISVEGVIVEGEGFVKRQIDRARKDDDVKAVVLRVNSPGGTITGSDYMYHHLSELVKEREIPMVVSMGGLAASGGYYVSMAVGDTPESIFAEPTTWTGSIGVIIPLFEAADLMEKWGINEDSVASHRLKNMGSFARHMTDEERAIFQALVEESFTRFKQIVKSGRPRFRDDPKALDKLATGQIYTAQQARAGGLIDRIGFVEDAIDRAIELAGLDEDDVRVVKYAPEPTVADILFGGSVQSPRLDLASLLDLGSPRAYYLWTRLPPLVRSGS